eukprot:4778324-Lingulodinium_polyedra.AAC.1
MVHDRLIAVGIEVIMGAEGAVPPRNQGEAEEQQPRVPAAVARREVALRAAYEAGHDLQPVGRR